MKQLPKRLATFVLAGFAIVGFCAFAAACSSSDNSTRRDTTTPDESPTTLDPNLFGPGLPSGPDGAPTAASCSATDTISWNAAVDHVNQKVTVIGPVYKVDESGSQTKIVMGSDQVGPGKRLDIVITGNALKQMQGDPQAIFSNSQICVNGVIQAVQGNLEIVVDQSKDIEQL